MTFDRARAVADAVMFEGYSLYPYRPSSTKNQLRWQFGVLAPRAWTEDPWFTETQVLVRGGTRLEGRLRFLRLRRRRIRDDSGRWVERLERGDKLLLPWDEGEVCELEFTQSKTIELPGDVEEAGNIVRTRAPLALRLEVSWHPLGELMRLTVRTENLTPMPPGTRRDDMLVAAAIGTHLLLWTDGAFVSLIDPPEDARVAAESCKQTGAFPVLAGAPGQNDLVLSAPIILYDHPQVAPESPGDLYDATEIDEILTLRTMTLTEEEKRQARATDDHVAKLIDRVDHLPPEMLERLHGAFRQVGPVARGARVRLRPGARRSDAQDMFLSGRIATVQAVMRDLDGRPCLAVTVDDDPAAELHAWHGRYHYFYPDEIEPLP